MLKFACFANKEIISLFDKAVRFSCGVVVLVLLYWLGCVSLGAVADGERDGRRGFPGWLL